MSNPTAAAPTPPVTDANLDKQEGAALMKEIQALKDNLEAQNQEIKVLKAQPLNNTPAQVVGDAFDKMIDMENGAKKHRHIVDGWGAIQKAMNQRCGKDGKQSFEIPGLGIQNSNTIDATLTTSLLSTTSYTVLQNKLAPLQALFLEVQADRMKPKAKVEVPKTTAGPTAQTDPTNWESGNSTVSYTELTMHEYSASCNISSADLQNGSRMEWLAYITAMSFCNKLIDVILTNVTTVNYGAAVKTIGSAAFGPGDLPDILAAAKDFNTKNLVLDGAYTARLVATTALGLGWNNNGAGYGFDKIVQNNRWSAAGANVVGFAADPLALPCAVGLPINPPGSNSAFNSIEATTVPIINMPVQLASWVVPGTRILWMAYDNMFGCNTGDTNALKIITSA